jgi:hypothetical protein
VKPRMSTREAHQVVGLVAFDHEALLEKSIKRMELKIIKQKTANRGIIEKYQSKEEMEIRKRA